MVSGVAHLLAWIFGGKNDANLTKALRSLCAFWERMRFALMVTEGFTRRGRGGGIAFLLFASKSRRLDCRYTCGRILPVA